MSAAPTPSSEAGSGREEPPQPLGNELRRLLLEEVAHARQRHDLRVRDVALDARERLRDVEQDPVLGAVEGYEATSVAEILDAAGIGKGALYHHFASKAELFDAVLDRLVEDVAVAAAERARRAPGRVASLKAGCAAWLEMTLDPAVQRIGLLDAAAVVGWARMRGIDERHTLSGIRVNLERIGGLEADADLFAHMVLAAVNEAALFIARADDPEAALETGRRAVDELIDRLTTRQLD
jgi:AcrR family transcriptional regulator